MATASVSDQEFDQLVLRGETPVVAGFRAAWCSASQRLTPMLDDLAGRFAARVQVVGVDVDADPRANKICRQYDVTRLPVVMVFREGRVADFIGGVASPDNLVEMVDRQLRPVLDVGEHTFDVEVVQARVPVLVHVDAAWCAQSRQLAPVVEETAKRFRGRAKVVRLEYGPMTARLCAQYGFVRVPTLALFSGGRVVDQIFGPMSDKTRTGAVAEMVDQFLL
jgi:thioredoxin 1